MVDHASTYDFVAIIDGFFAKKKVEGRHAPLITASVRARALSILATPDIRYMPAFKILDMLAAMVNIAAAIAEAPQLRPAEAQLLLRESLSESSPLVRQFMLEASLERARYEPMMLIDHVPGLTCERDRLLQLRWAAMRAAHQERAKLPDRWMDAINSAVEHALNAKDFQKFRQGPLLQLFAEMLAKARSLHHAGEPLHALAACLSENGALWRRYALKTARYAERSTPSARPLPNTSPSHTMH